ncbi:MAG: hypothetical protein RBU24_10295 [Kiritimatiellia bacterium]|nr:hypothetical protein [Kiritimatiellia bacterium]
MDTPVFSFRFHSSIPIMSPTILKLETKEHHLDSRVKRNFGFLIMKSLLVLVASLFILCEVGCILPDPSCSMIAFGLRGRIVATDTKTAIPNVRVEEDLAPGMVEGTVTANDGLFDVQPVKQRHWGRSFGLALNHPLPNDKRFLGEPVRLRLSHPGYMDKEVVVLTPDWPLPIAKEPVPHRAVAVTNKYLELGVIEMQKRVPPVAK